MQTNRSVIVLGGSGFLGTHLCEQFWKNGVKAIVLDKVLGCDLATDIGQSIFMDTLRSTNSRDVDIVMMAARLGAHLFNSNPIEPFIENKTINEKTIKTIIEANKTLRKKMHVTFYSTSEVYGNDNSTGMPQIDPNYPRSLYAQEKLITETMLHYYHDNGNISTLRIIRPFNLTGRWQRRGVVYEMTKTAIQENFIDYGEGCTREITFAEDATKEAVELILNREHGTFNLTSKWHIELKDLANAIKNILVDKKLVDNSLVVTGVMFDEYISKRGTHPLLASPSEIKEFEEALRHSRAIEDIASSL